MVTARGDITVFRGTYKFDNFYFNYHIEANQVNFSPFSRFEIRTPDVHRSVPPNVHLGTVLVLKHKKFHNKINFERTSNQKIHVSVFH